MINMNDDIKKAQLEIRRLFIRDVNILKGILTECTNLDDNDIFNDLMSFTLCLFENINLGGKVIMLGNGGSASDCAHIIGELRGRFILNRSAITALSLSDCVATTTAIANDFGYENLFKRQLDGITESKDSIIALSTSGTSKNIINSIVDVNKKYPNINSLFITGLMTNKNPDFKYHIQIPVECTKINVARIQESTMFLLHSMCKIIDMLYTMYNELDVENSQLWS